MDDTELDRLLAAPPMPVPEGFSERVMARIAPLDPATDSRRIGPRAHLESGRAALVWLRRAAMVAVGLVGLGQLGAHLLSNWLAAIAG